MAMIVVVDYGLGNLGSVANMLRRIGVRPSVTSDRSVIERATGLILPGVGHFDEGMRNLHERGLVELLTRRVVEQGVPVLGICLGLQLMARRSEEGNASGLAWLAADVQRFRFEPGTHFSVPHMGWAKVESNGDPLFAGLSHEEARFYFVHSYHLQCDDARSVIAWCQHGYRFAAAVRSKNVWGTQFHPEKSHRHGMKLLRNFAQMAGYA